MIIRSHLLNFILLLLSVVVSFTIIEIGWRFIVLGNSEIFKHQKRAVLYADPYSENEYWLLRYHWFRKKKNAERRKYAKNRKLQSTEKKLNTYIFRDTYKHTNSVYVGNRRPVLLFGDSFAACYSQNDCFDHIFNNDETFSTNHYLLNYGVGGFGLDQIYMLLKKSIDNYKDPFVVVSLMILDLDRSILAVREVPKPFYSVENDVLILHDQHFNPDEPEDFFRNNEPRILSYFYRRVIYSIIAKKFVPEKILSYFTKETFYKRKKIEINNKILLEIIKELRFRNFDFIFLIFHPTWIRGVGHLDDNVNDWRNSFIRGLFDENTVSYIWAKDIILQDMKAKNLSLSDYFIEDGHPNAYQRKLLSQKIKEFVFNPKLSMNRGN